MSKSRCGKVGADSGFLSVLLARGQRDGKVFGKLQRLRMQIGAAYEVTKLGAVQRESEETFRAVEASRIYVGWQCKLRMQLRRSTRPRRSLSHRGTGGLVVCKAVLINSAPYPWSVNSKGSCDLLEVVLLCKLANVVC